MRVGTENSSLFIENRGAAGGRVTWSLRAQMQGESWSFSFVDEQLTVDIDEELKRALSDFTSVLSHRLEVPLPQGGWLRFRRNPRGHIVVGYQLPKLKEGASVQGHLLVKAELATELCHQLGGLI